jgi:hypothetical protein
MDAKRLLAQQRHIDAHQVRKAEAEARRLLTQRQQAQLWAIRTALRRTSILSPSKDAAQRD